MFEGQGTSDVPLLFVVGSDDPDKLSISGNKFQVAGSTDIYKLLGREQPFHRLQMTPKYFRQARRPELGGYRCILNLITEAEQNGKVLENLKKLVRGLPAKIINRPDAVLRSTRDQVARQLSGIEGLQVPRAIRLRAAKPEVAMRAVEKAGLTYPIILREAGTHTGRIVGCFGTADELRVGLEGDGDRIATEFVDFKSADGNYRKYRVFFIGQRIILRHMLASDHWNVHAKDRRRFMLARPELIDEERQLFADPEDAFSPEIGNVLQEVRKRIALDFFGMDFGIGPDGRVVLFEANATMNFFPFLQDPELAHVLRCGPLAEAAFRDLLGLPPRSPHREWEPNAPANA
jgi:glutathione synthase/RimK-type ligase-like ATP-grasp enzyme